MIIPKPIRTSIALAVTAWQMASAALLAADKNSVFYPTWDASRMPIIFYVNAGDAASWPEAAGAIIRSFMNWERIPGAYVPFQYAGTTEKKNARDDGYNVVTWVREGWPYGSDTVAFAVLWVSQDSERIIGVDVLFNAEDFTWAIGDGSDAMDVQDVATHEVGHALGLEHSVSSTDVTMFPVIAPGETRKRSISEEEQWIIRALYPCGTTRVDTYAFWNEDGDLYAETAVVGYPPAQGTGKIFLLTRVDADGDGLDELATIQQENGRLAFYLFSAVSSDAPPAEPLAYDAWSIPEGNGLRDITAVDIDGDARQEIGVLRAEADGSSVLYIYDTPPPLSATQEDTRSWVRRQTFDVESGDNPVAVVGMDYNRDRVDEVGVIRLTPQGHYFLDVHYVGQADRQAQQPLASIFLPGIAGFVDLDVSDINGDGKWDLIVLLKDNRGWYMSAFELPDVTESPEERQATLLATVPLPSLAGRRPMCVSSVRIADPDGFVRPAICILMGENM